MIELTMVNGLDKKRQKFLVQPSAIICCYDEPPGTPRDHGAKTRLCASSYTFCVIETIAEIKKKLGIK